MVEETEKWEHEITEEEVEAWKPCCTKCPWREDCRYRDGFKCLKPTMTYARCE